MIFIYFHMAYYCFSWWKVKDISFLKSQGKTRNSIFVESFEANVLITITFIDCLNIKCRMTLLWFLSWTTTRRKFNDSPQPWIFNFCVQEMLIFSTVTYPFQKRAKFTDYVMSAIFSIVCWSWYAQKFKTKKDMR